MADILGNGLFFTEFLVDNPSGSGFDTDGDGAANKSDEYIRIQNSSGDAVSMDGIEIWSATKGLLYSFDAAAVVNSGGTATVVGEYTGSPPDGYYSAGIVEGGNFLLDGEGAQFDTLYLVDTTTGEYVAFSYGDPPQTQPLPTGFTGTTQVGGGESISSTGPNGFTFERDGSGTFIESTPDPPPCYAPGTMIDTPDGPRAVETLAPGDLVTTQDHGQQPVRWVQSGEQSLEAIADEGRPVVIRAGALGRGLPVRDLVVSPQHRILVGGGGQLGRFFGREAFAPAKALTGLPGIGHVSEKARTTWVHFACDRHEVVTANGCLTESLLLGPVVLRGMTRPERRAVTGIFGAPSVLNGALNGPAARACLTVGQVRRQLARHLKPTGSAPRKPVLSWKAGAAVGHQDARGCPDAGSSHAAVRRAAG